MSGPQKRKRSDVRKEALVALKRPVERRETPERALEKLANVRRECAHAVVSFDAEAAQDIRARDDRPDDVDARR